VVHRKYREEDIPIVYVKYCRCSHEVLCEVGVGEHYTFGKATPQSTSALSQRSIDIVLINTVAPLFYARGELTDNYELHDRAIALLESLRRDPVAVMTGIYTGAGERNWVFYVLTLKAFQAMINNALGSINEQLPLSFHAEEDPHWEEYREMCQCEIAREE
jgi:hypothetical protein